MNHSDRVEIRRPSSAPKRVGVVKTLHIPADVLFDMIEQFMENKGLSAAGYRFMSWDIQKEAIGPEVHPHLSEECEHVFKGVVLQKIAVKQLFEAAEEDEEEWFVDQPH